jgi:hypothetical protein
VVRVEWYEGVRRGAESVHVLRDELAAESWLWGFEKGATKYGKGDLVYASDKTYARHEISDSTISGK